MPAERSLEVNIRHQLGSLALSTTFRTTAPWALLFGSSGSGKSTILRAIAGVLRPTAGRIVIDGQVVFDSAKSIWLPPHQRPMRWAPQRAMLYPWKKVKSQLSMGIRDSRFATERALLDETDRVIGHFGLQALADLRPHQLSGGQRQLIGVVRAAAGLDDRLLLLDEPFTGLDSDIRERLIQNLRSWIGESPVLSVTHDVEEAFMLEADVIRIHDGRVSANGPVEQILLPERYRVLRNLHNP